MKAIKRFVRAIVFWLAEMTDGKKVLILAQMTVMFNAMLIAGWVKLALDYAGLINIGMMLLISVARALSKTPGFLAWVSYKAEVKIEKARVTDAIEKLVEKSNGS